MKSVIGLIHIFFYSTVAVSQHEYTPSLEKADFSSVDAFWIVVDRLKNDETLSQDQWVNLFNTPYYNFYKDWGQESFIRQVLMSTFMPSKKQSRDSILSLNNWRTLLFQHLIGIDSLRSELQEFRSELENRNVLDEALKKAEVYLPNDIIKQYADRPKVAFGLYQPDGNAGKIIVVDLRLAMEIDIIGFIAHEAHHYYSVKIRRKLKEEIEDSTRLLINSIFQLQLEGVADLINKEEFLESNGQGFPSQLVETYKKHYQNPFPVLNTIDSLIVSAAAMPTHANKNYQLIKEILPLGGHPHGYYMAKTILENEGKEALIETIENPFDFIRVYNAAATKNEGAFVFSKKSLEFLKTVEETYLVN